MDQSAKVALLEREHKETVSLGLKAALVLEMMPESVQMSLAQGLSAKGLDYGELKAKIKLNIKSKVKVVTQGKMNL